MQYKTIALELIQEQPELYERLRSSKRLLPAMDAYAIDLKAGHEAWMDRLVAEYGSFVAPSPGAAVFVTRVQRQPEPGSGRVIVTGSGNFPVSSAA